MSRSVQKGVVSRCEKNAMEGRAKDSGVNSLALHTLGYEYNMFTTYGNLDRVLINVKGAHLG